MHLHRRQSVQRVRHVSTGHLQSLIQRLAYDQLSDHAGRSHSRPATECLELDVFYALVLDAHVHLHEIAAHWISHAPHSHVFPFNGAHVARVAEVVQRLLRILSGLHVRPPMSIPYALSLIHISEPTRRTPISYAVFCLKKKKTKNN